MNPPNNFTARMILIASIALVGWGLLRDSQMTGSIGLSDRFSGVVRMQDRQMLKDSLLGLAFAIEQDGLRPEGEQYTPDKDGAIEDMFHLLHERLGPDSPKLGELNPQLPDFMVSELGDIPEFPEGRNVFAQKLRDIAEDL